MRELFELFAVFARIGSVNFGGGYAMLPLLQQDLEQKRHWVTTQELLDYFAIGQCTPGIIAINVSAFIGYRQKKIPGAIAAALGMVSPCIVIISIIAAFLSNFQDNLYVKHALAGVSVCVAGLILDAVLNMWKKGVKDVPGIIICLAMLALSLFSSISPILLVIACALLGIGIGSIKRRAHKEDYTL